MIFTLSEVEKLAPGMADVYRSAFGATGANQTLDKYAINATPLRLCHFFAQILEETGGFRATIENLNYSVARLQVVWPSRFRSAAEAQPYADNPEKLGEHVYGGRLGNDAPGDGYKYRGRGLLQITGKAAYRRYGEAIGVDLVANPDLAIDSRYCLEIAAAEYAATGYKGKYCNEWADLDDIEAITRAVNGGLTNLAQRRSALAQCKAIWMTTAPLSAAGPVVASVAAGSAAAAAAAAPEFLNPPPPAGAVHSYLKMPAQAMAVAVSRGLQTPAAPASLGVCKPYFKVRPMVTRAHASGAQGARRSWSVGDLCTAYSWPTGLTGAGVIAIVELGGGYVDADISAFCQGAGIPVPAIANVSVHPGAGNAPNQATDPNNDPDIEVTMDIEVAAAAYSAATGLPAQIRMYWALNQPGGIADAVRKATADGCAVCSISWGADESDWRSWASDGGTQYLDDMEQAAAAAVAAGMVVFAAAGDNDASDGGPTPANVDLPSSCPSVVGCGGTTKTAINEVVWNNTPGSPSGQGTGGGFSKAFPRPNWQASAPGDPQNPNGPPMRMIPDVAANADVNTGYNLVVHGVEDAFGGTSAVAPLYAGLFAAVGAGLGFIADRLWANPSCFVDITVGDNGEYYAGPGPDPCTGLGAPVGAALATLFATPAVAAPAALAAAPRAADGFDAEQAIVYGQLIDQAYAMFANSPGNLTPPPGVDFPPSHRLTAWVQMQDFIVAGTGPVFYGFIAQSVENPSRSVLALRGTQNFTELFDDATSVWRVPFKDYADCGAVSYGFARIYETLRLVEAPAPPTPGAAMAARAAPRALAQAGGFAAQVAAHIKGVASPTLLARVAAPTSTSELDIVGHSLGAALATLYALDNARTEKLTTPVLYTFASPMVGDPAFVAAFNQLDLASWRIVNAPDLVPQLPSAILGYAHVDREQRYDSRGKVQPDELCLHAMTTYLHLIDQDLPLGAGCTLAPAVAAAVARGRARR